MSTTGNESDYTAVTGTQLTDLAAGTYYIRYAGNDNYLPSIPTAITISAGRMITISFNTDGGTAIPDITGALGDDVEIPADPTKTGHTFVAWDQTIPSTIPDENMTITDCAFMSGFQSTTTFNKVFRDTTGCTPREYRKMHSKN